VSEERTNEQDPKLEHSGEPVDEERSVEPVDEELSVEPVDEELSVEPSDVSAGPAEEGKPAEPAEEDAADLARMSDEEIAEAARAFLGETEPKEEEVSEEEAKALFRRAVTPEPEPSLLAAAEVAVAAPPAPIVPQAPSTAPMPKEGEQRWYVIHTYSGHENKVKTNLEHRIASLDMKDKIFQVLVPTEEEIEIKNGKRYPVEKKVFPGYVLVEMIMDDDSWYVVRNTPGVTSFVGSGNKPTPLTDQEVKQILRQIKMEQPKYKVAFQKGEAVRVTDGPFADFHGVVDEVHPDRNKVKVLVSIFGRETPVELDFLQIEKLVK
jgi:transcriptional antiterminator NusG